MTKHETIAIDIMTMIRKGFLNPGDKLPSNDILMDRYEVGYGTLYKAKRMLQRRGLVYSTRPSPGSKGGTFVEDMAPFLV